MSEEFVRRDWLLGKKNIGQAIATVSQIMWTSSTEDVILTRAYEMPMHLDDIKDGLVELTGLIRGNLTSLERKILVALITTDVHGRDIVELLNKEQVQDINDFNWQ